MACMLRFSQHTILLCLGVSVELEMFRHWTSVLQNRDGLIYAVQARARRKFDYNDGVHIHLSAQLP